MKHTQNIEEEKSNSTSAAQSTADRNPNNMVQATKDAELVIDTSEQIEIVSTFDQLGLNEQLLRGRRALHFAVEFN